MKIYNNILETIGNTPLVKINKLNTTNANIFAKVEYFNPAGSIKDRVALALIENAEKNNLIQPNISTIIEPTSGNTGIGLALVCLIKGYRLILTMPDTMSKERQSYLKAYGAELVLTDGKLGMQGAIEKAQELNKEIENSYIPQQFENNANPNAHYNSTAMELFISAKGNIDFLVAGIGTSGTICGISKKLKELIPSIKIIGIEPENSPMISKGYSNPHKIQGIGANFIPKLYNEKLINEIITIKDEEAIEYTKLLAQKEGIFAGISSGAAICGAIKIAQREENKNKNIIAIFPDGGAKYLSNIEYWY